MMLASGTCGAQVRTGTQAGKDTVAPARDTTARRDTTGAVRSPSGVDTTVVYSASDSITYDLTKRTMYLYGKADIQNRELRLRAERVNINWTTSVLNAQGVPDSTDTTGRKYRGLPDLIDGSETYHGFTVSYNFKSKKGKIDVGKTEIEKGLYYGEEIKKIDTDMLFVADGKFTTCDLEHPHYYFASPEMKVIVKDKIIARPVFLYIDDVPVFALPFGIFPGERGRRSGLIAPAYGESSRGRYLTHLGYYWAMNDYMDWNARADGYSKGSYTLYSDFRYALRYKFTGSISGSYGRSIFGNVGDPGYSDQRVFNIHLGHSQEFDPTTHLIVDFSFMSGSYYQRTSNDLGDLLQQNAVSNATLTKSWEGTPNSMTINIRRDQNLQPTLAPGQYAVVVSQDLLPNISFNHSQSFPFRSSKRSGSSDLAWYEMIGLSYSGQYEDVRTKYMLATGDSIGENRGVAHSVGMNASPKLGYFTITPQISYSEWWYDSYINRFVDADGNVVTQRNKAITAARAYSLSVSASTKLYGVIQPNIFGITGIRHQVLPSVAYVYTPDFSAPGYGFYGRYIDTTGRQQVYSHHEGSILGGPGAGRQQAVQFNLGNVFDMKTMSSDSGAQENKFQLLNLNLGLSYNFAADSLRFSDLSMNFRTSIGQLLSIGGNANYSLYQAVRDPSGYGYRINKLLINQAGRLGDLTQFGISVGTHLSGEKKKTTSGPILADSTARTKSGYIGLRDQDIPDFSIPWNLDLTWSFSQSQPFPWQKFRSSTISAKLGFNLTDMWKFDMSANYDIVNKVFVTPAISVYRDLHCWEMSFYWVPIGTYRNFRLEIKLKEPQLQDIKVTKQESARGIY